MTTYSKLWHLLSSEQRRSTVVLFSFMIFATLLETLGIGILVPAIALITQDHLTDKYPSLEPWLSILGNPSHEQLIIAGMLILVAVYAIKAVYLAFYAWKQAGFVSEIMANFSRRLFECYLNQSYTFHLQRNSAQLIQNTIGQVSGVTTVVANSQLLFTELLIVLGVSIMLVLIEPIGALLVMSVIGTAAWSFQRFTRGRILRWGKVFQIHEGLRIQYLQEGLGGAKDVKLLGRESNFLTQYNIHTTSSARIKKNQTTLLALPRLWLELLAVTGLAILVLVMIGQGKPVQSILPTLGVFAVAAFRLMPSVTRILSSIQGLRFSIPMIDTVHSEFQLLEGVKIPTHGKPFSYKTILTLEHVNFRYPSTEANALDDINLSIYRGTTVGFIGGSGAGKSTLVDIILGLLTPANGKVNIDGTNIQTNLRGWQDQIGYVPQAIFLTDDSLRRNIAFGVPEGQIDEMAVCRAIHDAQLEEFINELPNGSDTLVGERGIRLSGGQRQRIGIARALYHDPQVLVLDEATSSLDTVTEQEVMNAVQFFKGEKTIIIVAHRLSTVEQCDHLFHLEKGRIVDKGETAMILKKVAGATAGT